MTVLRYLKKGKEKAIPGNQLANLIYGSKAYQHVVWVQDEIRDMRLIGARIVACNRGYYLTDDLKELFAFTGKLKKHADKIIRMAKNMEKTARSKLNGQKKLLLKRK